MSLTSTQASTWKKLRIREFATFFKRYMSVSTILAASIPIPIASWRLIPIYSQQKGFLTVYASLLCFLLVALVFSIRHYLAPRMFSAGLQGSLIATLPFVFMVSTLACILAYHVTLQQSVQQLRNMGARATTTELLNKTDSTEIPYGLTLAASYLGIFLFAEASFVLMAIREYLQDVLHLDERTLLRGTPGFPKGNTTPSVSVSESSKISRPNA